MVACNGYDADEEGHMGRIRLSNHERSFTSVRIHDLHD